MPDGSQDAYENAAYTHYDVLPESRLVSLMPWSDEEHAGGFSGISAGESGSENRYGVETWKEEGLMICAVRIWNWKTNRYW